VTPLASRVLVTVIGLPVGLTLIALGFKYLTLSQRRFL